MVRQSPPQLCFLKINVSSKESLELYKDLLGYFGYKKKYDKKYYLGMSNGKTEFLIFHGAHIGQSGTYISSPGISSFYLEAKTKSAVDKFNKEFLKTRKIKPTVNYITKNKRLREVFFFNKEGVGFGLENKIQNNGKDFSESDVRVLTFRLINEESLIFHKKLLMFLGYRLIGEDKIKKANFRGADIGNNEITFGLYISDLGMKNNEGSDAYIPDTGITTLFLRVKDRQVVDNLIKKFLKPNKVNYVFNNPCHEKEGRYSVFFDTPEKITIGIIS
jgi:hypothetical protein